MLLVSNTTLQKKVQNKIKKTWQVFAALSVFICSFILSPSVFAIDVGAQLHKTSDGIGYSIVASDSFVKAGNARWGVALTTMNDLEADWNDLTTSFNTSTFDVFTAYRFKPRTYNSFWKPFSWELQAGASISLTENKFTFDSFPDQQIVFSEQGDINFMAAAVAQYKISKKTNVQLGYKIYPSFSEFGSQSSIFFGFSYRFGASYDY